MRWMSSSGRGRAGAEVERAGADAAVVEETLERAWEAGRSAHRSGGPPHSRAAVTVPAWVVKPASRTASPVALASDLPEVSSPSSGRPRSPARRRRGSCGPRRRAVRRRDGRRGRRGCRPCACRGGSRRRARSPRGGSGCEAVEAAPRPSRRSQAIRSTTTRLRQTQPGKRSNPPSASVADRSPPSPRTNACTRAAAGPSASTARPRTRARRRRRVTSARTARTRRPGVASPRRTTSASPRRPGRSAPGARRRPPCPSP